MAKAVVETVFEFRSEDDDGPMSSRRGVDGRWTRSR